MKTDMILKEERQIEEILREKVKKEEDWEPLNVSVVRLIYTGKNLLKLSRGVDQTAPEHLVQPHNR
jgi:hypothetical protein